MSGKLIYQFKNFFTGNSEIDKIVRESNVHRHTKSCQKYSEGCRFHFPKPPSKHTIIAKPAEEVFKEDGLSLDGIRAEVKKAEKYMAKVKDALKSLKDEECYKYDDNLQGFLNDYCDGITEDLYHKYLSISENGRSVILKREVSERMVNNYNKTFSLIWNANSDIQLCLDSYAVVTYITDYLCKSEKGLTNLLRTALKEKKDCEWKELLNHLKKVYFKSKQSCVSEAAYRLIPSLNLKGSTIKTLFVNSGLPEKRQMYLHKIGDEDDDEYETTDPNAFSIEGRKGKFLKPVSKHDRYDRRPFDEPDENCEDGIMHRISFAQFCMVYETKSKSELPKNITWNLQDEGLITKFGKIGETAREMQRKRNIANGEEVDEKKPLLKDFITDEDLPQWIRLIGEEERYMKLRSNPFVLRTYSSKRNNPIEKIYSELLLFTNWRNEMETFENEDPKFEEKLLAKWESNQDLWEATRKKIYPFSNKLEAIKDLLDSEDFVRSSHIYDTVNSTAEQENEDDEENIEPPNISDEFEESENYMHHHKKRDRNAPLRAEKLFKQPVLPQDDDELLAAVRLLSYEQRVVFDEFIHFCKSVVCSQKYGGNIEPVPPRIITTGKN